MFSGEMFTYIILSCIFFFHVTIRKERARQCIEGLIIAFSLVKQVEMIDETFSSICSQIPVQRKCYFFYLEFSLSLSRLLEAIRRANDWHHCFSSKNKCQQIFVRKPVVWLIWGKRITSTESNNYHNQSMSMFSEVSSENTLTSTTVEYSIDSWRDKGRVSLTIIIFSFTDKKQKWDHNYHSEEKQIPSGLFLIWTRKKKENTVYLEQTHHHQSVNTHTHVLLPIWCVIIY